MGWNMWDSLLFKFLKDCLNIVVLCSDIDGVYMVWLLDEVIIYVWVQGYF